MSTFSDSESTTASPSETEMSPRDNGEQSRTQSGWLDDESTETETPTLEINRCPECGARRFVSKLLVYEVTSFDEGGDREFRRQHVRAEFEFTCSECQTTLRTLPAIGATTTTRSTSWKRNAVQPSEINSGSYVGGLSDGSGQ